LAMNGHGGNYLLGNVVQEANSGSGVRPLPSAGGLGAGPGRGRPGDVGPRRHARRGARGSPSCSRWSPALGQEYREGDHEAAERRRLLVLGMEGYTKSGIIGRPSLGTESKVLRRAGRDAVTGPLSLARRRGATGQESRPCGAAVTGQVQRLVPVAVTSFPLDGLYG